MYLFHLKKKKKSSHYFIVSKGRTKIKIISLVFLLLVIMYKEVSGSSEGRLFVITEEWQPRIFDH